MIGQRYGDLTVLRATTRTVGRDRVWLCRCACGVETEVIGGNLRGGHTKSCGCRRAIVARQNFRQHGLSHTRTHNAWSMMWQRCTNPKMTGFDRWGGRGITVYRRWRKFGNFLDDMGMCPPGMSIDRKDNDGNYTPLNCRWATAQQQNQNRRN